MIKTRHCKRCDRETRQEISKRIIASGAEFFGWWCLECKFWCNQLSGGVWIEKEKLKEYGIDLTLAPIVDNQCLPRCAKCGTRGAEVHHWMPQSISSDADRWPMDYLCKFCHDEWHKIVTPSLVKGMK